MQYIILFILLTSLTLSAPPSLPKPSIDIPKDIDPPLTNGRNDYHGWLYLPHDYNETNNKILHGYFYHHTPEFWTVSPHDFEMMVKGSLQLDIYVPHLPTVHDPLVGTEYVFTPPSFSLDELITSKVLNYNGRFSNGSFDTSQRYVLSNGELKVTEFVTVHYLEEHPPGAYDFAPYLSYPRKIGDYSMNLKYLYFLHLVEAMPDFDQVVNVVLDPKSCVFYGGDDMNDLMTPGATFLFPSVINQVKNRVGPWNGQLAVNLLTDRNRYQKEKTRCFASVIEEIHCVVVPDSFEKCPPVKF